MNVVKYTFPDDFQKNFEKVLLDSIKSHYNIKDDQLNSNKFKRIHSRFDYYDLEKHFNANQKINFLDTLAIKKIKQPYYYIESIFFINNYTIIQYSNPFGKTMEILEFYSGYKGFKIIASLTRDKVYDYDRNFTYKYRYRKIEK